MKKTNIQDIYTVIIAESFAYEGGDVSTVSFLNLNDAIKYCVSEIEEDKKIAEEKLEEEFFYNDGERKYYIEEAKLLATWKFN